MERRSRDALDALPVAIYTTDAAGRITYYNQAAVDLVGRRPVLGEDQWCVTWRLYWPDGTPMPHDQCPMAVALRENRAVRGVLATLERPDGQRVPFICYPTPLRDASGALVGAVNMLVDVAERTEAAKARAYLAAIVNSSDDAIISKNLDGIVTSWNRGAQETFGYRADEMIGRPISVLFPPERLTEEDMIVSRLRRGERVEHFETVRLHKDGHELDIALTISPIRDTTGRIIGASKIARDITDRKRAEAALRELNETLEMRVVERTSDLVAATDRLRAEMEDRKRAETALLQAQKMESVGQLAAGVAHDFNNLLTSIFGNLDLLDQQIANERQRKLIQAAVRSAVRGAKLTEQMLAFSRKQHLAAKSVDVNGLVSGIEDMLRRAIGGTIEVTTALAPDLWPALVDPHQLELAILNLTINARDAMPFGGRLSLETRVIKVSELDRSADMAPGDYVVVAVADTGKGMSEEVLARACEPFFTTKEVGEGTGLGLAQVYGFARQSGGGIKIKSALSEGTTVEIWLPRSLAPAEVASATGQAPAGGIDGMRTVLVVDDQEEVREVTAAQLESLGYRVVQAASGHTALDLVGNGGGLDLLIVDYAMPGMSGIEVARAVADKCPDLPVIVATGYVDTSRFDKQAPQALMMKKPYRITELAKAVEHMLRHGPQRGIRNIAPLRKLGSPGH